MVAARGIGTLYTPTLGGTQLTFQKIHQAFPGQVFVFETIVEDLANGHKVQTSDIRYGI